MDEIKHFILTRYNVASPGREQALRLKPGWLDKRFDLFKEFCLPGVASQTRKDFEWIIFFDRQTPKDYMDRIQALQSVFPFRIEYTDLFEMNKICPQLVAERGGAEWLLTTRLDSDDILAVDFVERLRGGLKPKTEYIVNFPNGLIMSLHGKAQALYLDRDESSPFASLLEPFTNNINTIWQKQHRHIDEIAPITQMEGKPAWLQIVHGDNVANHVRGVRVPMTRFFQDFPYLKTVDAAHKETAAVIAFENYTLTPLRKTKECARSIVKKMIARR